MSFFVLLVAITLGLLLFGVFAIEVLKRRLNMDQLQVSIAIAAGFLMAFVFLELLPESLEHFESGPKIFFRYALLGVLLVLGLERYLVPRLKFVEKFFPHASSGLKRVETHDDSLHDHGHHDHHHHHDLSEAENCASSHQHAHLHAHTHPDVMGAHEVCSAIACFMLCSFFDGVALSSVHQVDASHSMLLAFAVVLHLLPEGVLSGAMAIAGGATLASARKVFLFIGGSFVCGAVLPFLLPGFEGQSLGISSGILICVTLVQLLPSSLKLRYAPIWMVVGFLLFTGLHEVLVFFGGQA